MCMSEIWGRFLKVPTLFGRISGEIVFFVSSKSRRLEAQTFELILIFIPFKTYEIPTLQNWRVVVLRMAFRALKVFGTFRETGRAPGPSCSKTNLANTRLVCILIAIYLPCKAELSQNFGLVRS